MGGCIVDIRIRLLLLIRPFTVSFSNIQTLKIFVILFSETARPRRLKPGAHMDSGWMYRVYRNQVAAAYSSLYFFFHFSFQFSNIKMFLSHFSLELWGLKGWNVIPTWTMGGWIVYTESFHNIFSRTARHKKLRQYKVTNMKNTMYCVYWNPAAHTFFFLFLALQFSAYTNLSFSSDSAKVGL